MSGLRGGRNGRVWRVTFLFILSAIVIAGVTACGRPDEQPEANPENDEGPLSLPEFAEETSTLEPAALSTEDEVAVYAAVIRRLMGPDDGYGPGEDFRVSTMYVVRDTTRYGYESKAPDAELTPISPAVQAGLVEGLADLPYGIVWVETWHDVQRDPVTGVAADAVTISPGAIWRRPDGRLVVTGEVHRSSLGASYMTYVLDTVDGSWSVVGRIGGWIVS